MRRRVAVAVAIACALVQPALTAAPAGSAPDPKAPLPDSVLAAEDAMPDDVREALYLAQLEASIAAHEAWVRAFEASGRSVAGLPVVEDMGLLPAPPRTFAAAADAADAIVHATVVDHRYTTAGTYATLRVHGAVRPAGLPAEMDAAVVGGPGSVRGGEAVLAVPDGEIFLHVGTEAVLLLERDEFGWGVQPTTGTYVVGPDRRVRPAQGNPFGAAYEGMPLADLMAALRSAG